MKLLVIVVCLLSERFLIHGISFQRFSWFAAYCTKIMEWTADKTFLINPWARLIAVVFPVIFIVSFIYLLFDDLIFGLVGLLFSLGLFFYCLGPQNPFYPKADSELEVESTTSRSGAYFSEVNSELFTVIFCYLVGGPLLALTYRLIALCRNVESIQPQANQLTDIFEWIPARLTVLLFLLVGNFQSGLSLFSHYLLLKPSLNNHMLSECGLQAARSENVDEEIPLPVAERLVEHALIVLLVFIAFITMATSA